MIIKLTNIDESILRIDDEGSRSVLLLCIDLLLRRNGRGTAANENSKPNQRQHKRTRIRDHRRNNFVFVVRFAKLTRTNIRLWMCINFAKWRVRAMSEHDSVRLLGAEPPTPHALPPPAADEHAARIPLEADAPHIAEPRVGPLMREFDAEAARRFRLSLPYVKYSPAIFARRAQPPPVLSSAGSLCVFLSLCSLSPCPDVVALVCLSIFVCALANSCLVLFFEFASLCCRLCFSVCAFRA